MATANKNIGQYRGSNMGAYRNPKMIVEDPLVGLKSFQQSYNSMFAQMQLQKANEQKEKDEFEKAMSPFSDKIYDSQKNLKYYSELNRNTFQGSADAAVKELMSGNLSEREGKELARKFIDDQSVFNKLSDKIMVNKLATDQLDMSQRETQEFIKIANAFNSKNAVIFQDLNKEGGRYEVNGGVKIGDQTYTTTDLARIVGSIEQSQVINENNNKTLETSLKAITEKSNTDVSDQVELDNYNAAEGIISNNIDKLSPFLDEPESLNWLYSNKVKDTDKSNVTDEEITTALSAVGGFDYDRAGTYGALIKKNPSILSFGNEELTSLAMQLSAKDNIDDNDAEVLEELNLVKNAIKRNKAKNWITSQITKVKNPQRPTVESIVRSRVSVFDKKRQIDGLVTSYYRERVDNMFDEANKLDMEVIGPDDKETLERKQKLEDDIRNTFLNATFLEGGRRLLIEDVIIGKKNPETGETTDKTMMYFMYDTGKSKSIDGEEKKVVTTYRQVDYADMLGRSYVINGIIDGTYVTDESKARFGQLLEQGLPISYDKPTVLPLNQ